MSLELVSAPMAAPPRPPIRAPFPAEPVTEPMIAPVPAPRRPPDRARSDEVVPHAETKRLAATNVANAVDLSNVPCFMALASTWATTKERAGSQFGSRTQILVRFRNRRTFL